MCDKTWFITYYKTVFRPCFDVQYCFMPNLAVHVLMDQVLDTYSPSIFMNIYRVLYYIQISTLIVESYMYYGKGQ